MGAIALTGSLLAVLFTANEEPAGQSAFDLSRLQCVIGDNGTSGEHRPGYNGVFSLQVPDDKQSVFVPAYAGLNLEHYFDTRPRPSEREVFFEPRCVPMEFRRIDANAAELHQPLTPVYGVESWTRFELHEPCYVDMTFRCVPHKADLAGGALGVFWASYIHEPLDKSIYFLAAGSSLDKPTWTQYCTQEHGRDSTVRCESDTLDIPFAGGDGTLFNSISPLRYSVPFFYGRVGENVLIYVFRSNSCVRFSHSPSGGGRTSVGDAQNPAWDFQLIVPGYEVGKEYGLSMRLVCKRWIDRADVLAEVRKYLEAN